jgi:hypothetical protein
VADYLGEGMKECFYRVNRICRYQDREQLCEVPGPDCDNFKSEVTYLRLKELYFNGSENVIVAPELAEKRFAEACRTARERLRRWVG